MNSAKKDGLFFLIFLLIVGGLAYGQYFYINEMKGLKTEICELKTRSMKLDQQAKEQMKQIDVYKKAIAMGEHPGALNNLAYLLAVPAVAWWVLGHIISLPALPHLVLTPLIGWGIAGLALVDAIHWGMDRVF